MNELRLERGLWWVASDIECAAVLFDQVKSIKSDVLPYVKNFSTCVQAGGNCGLFPIELAREFRRVITAEPDPQNFKALEANIKVHANNVCIHEAAFGNSHDGLSVVTETGNCGASFVCGAGLGEIIQLKIDDFDSDECGLIYLDIEGFEEFALRGAERTIKSHYPTIVVEMKNLAHKYGRSDKDCADYLKQLGYQLVHSFDNDFVWSVR